VIIRGNRVAAAGCRLPLSDSPNISSNVHMRHRAALGLSENSDAVIVIVSEETGTISVAVNSKLIRGLNEDKLRRRLQEAFGYAAPRKPGRRGLGLPAGLSFGRRPRKDADTATSPGVTPDAIKEIKEASEQTNAATLTVNNGGTQG